MSDERTVHVQSIDSGDSRSGVGASVEQGFVSWEPMKFEQVLYNNFQAEHAYVEGNFVIHFFVHPDFPSMFSERVLEQWWQNDFARALSDVAQAHFKATLPRIQAKYTVENASWWFKAQGYDHLVSPSAFLTAFFELLDDTLLIANGQPPAHGAATASS